MTLTTREKSQNFINAVAYGLRNKGRMLDVPTIEGFALKVAQVFEFKGDVKALAPRIHEDLSDYYRQRIITCASDDALQAGDGENAAAALPFARRHAAIYGWDGNLQELAESAANDVVLRGSLREVFLPPLLRAEERMAKRRKAQTACKSKSAGKGNKRSVA